MTLQKVKGIPVALEGDRAVAEAYGWGEEWRAGLFREDEVLARLFRLNQARAGSR